MISESEFGGLRIIGGFATGNLVQGNFIGMDADGVTPRGNVQNGIEVAGAPGTTIGGTSAGARNLLSGNGHGGIWIHDAGATGTLVQGNFIGTDVTGALDRGNTLSGVVVTTGAPNTLIGGTVAGARNVISGNNQHGVQLDGALGTLIQANFIGTNAAGTAALSNTLHGVTVNGPGTVVGGRWPGRGT